jgi:geranylgeranyl pyrophosphate synthase
VLAGDYLFAWIFKNVTADYPHPVPHILATTLADITDGEVLQHRATRNLKLTVAEYTEIAIKKTAALFAASSECGALMAGATPIRAKALRDYGLYFGIAFQMLDDLLDLTASERELGKPVGNDLRERKMTIPLVLALEDAGPFAPDLRAFYASTEEGSPAMVAALIRGAGAAGGFTKTADAIGAYVERAKMSLAPLGAVAARADLAALADTLAADAATRLSAV